MAVIDFPPKNKLIDILGCEQCNSSYVTVYDHEYGELGVICECGYYSNSDILEKHLEDINDSN